MGPFLPEVYHFPLFGIDVDDERCARECLAEIHRVFSSFRPPEEVAAVIIEPMQGDGGMLPAHPIIMQKLHELCREHGILFIAEEVQQAFFRTGTWFSIEHYAKYGVKPDGIVLGKALGASFTLRAFMARDEIMDCLPAPAHTFTLGGNHLACAAGLAAMDVYESEEFRRTLEESTALLSSLIAGLESRHGDIIGFTRGLGMSRGIVIVKLKGGRVLPDGDGSFKIICRAYELGLIAITVSDSIIRIQPPLNISRENLVRSFELLSSAMDDFKAGKIGDDVLVHRRGCGI